MLLIRPSLPSRCSCSCGFSFVEIMAALAILAITLVTVIIAQSQSMALVEKARDISFVTEVARTKMAELELEFHSKGFGEIDENMSGEFEEEELADLRWSYELTKIEIPGVAGSEKAAASGGPVGLGMISDALSKSIRQLQLRVYWGSEEKGEYLEIVSLLTNSKELPRINVPSKS